MAEPADLVAAARAAGVTDERVLDAIGAVPRAAFVPPELAGRDGSYLRSADDALHQAGNDAPAGQG